MRTLAQRSAAAAREIKDLIAESAGQVHGDTQAVDSGRRQDEAHRRLGEQGERPDRGDRGGRRGTARVIGEVNIAVTRMDQVVQQNAALVEEASAATEAMKTQAGALLQVVSSFRLAANEGAESKDGAAQEWQQPAEATIQPIRTHPAPAPSALLRQAPLMARSDAVDTNWQQI